MLSKRFFRKISFLVLLVLIPIIVIIMGYFGKQESGLLRIILYQEDSQDVVSSKIVHTLLEESTILFFEQVVSKEEAYEAVRKGEADAVWIFPKQMQEKIDTFVETNGKSETLIQIVEREDTIALQLAREKLYGVLYAPFSYAVYENYMEGVVVEEEDKEKLQEYYDRVKVDGTLFEFAFLDGTVYENETSSSNYLLAPLRGMLSLLILLAGLAASLYFLKDEEAGVFAWLPLKKRTSYLSVYQFVTMSYVSLAVILALATQGMLIKIGIELLGMMLYMFMCAIFCSIFTKICRTTKNLGVLLPMIMLLSLVFCPIFFDIQIKPINYLLPPFYYLNVIHNSKYFLWMGLYCMIGSLVKIAFIVAKRSSDKL